MSALERWAAARTDAEALRFASNVDAAAAEFVKRYPRHPPDAFVYTTRQRRAAAARALGSGDGWLARLTMSCGSLTMYTLDYRALGMSREDADSSKLRDPATVARYKERVALLFGKHPHRAKLEAASSIHVHVLADAAACPVSVRLGSERAKPCDDDLERLAGYLSKPAAPYATEHLATYWKARRTLRRMPRLSWVANIPRSSPTATTNALRNYFAKTPLLADGSTSPESPIESTPARDVASQLDRRLHAATRSRALVSSRRRVVSARKGRRALEAVSSARGVARRGRHRERIEGFSQFFHAIRGCRRVTRAKTQVVKCALDVAQHGPRAPP